MKKKIDDCKDNIFDSKSNNIIRSMKIDDFNRKFPFGDVNFLEILPKD